MGKEWHVKCVYFLCHWSIFSSPDKCIQGNINNFKELKVCSEMLLWITHIKAELRPRRGFLCKENWLFLYFKERNPSLLLRLCLSLHTWLGSSIFSGALIKLRKKITQILVSPVCLWDYFRSNPSLLGSWGGFSPAPGRGCSTWAFSQVSCRRRESRKGFRGWHREEGIWEYQKVNCKPDVASGREKSSVWIEHSLWHNLRNHSRGNALEQQDFTDTEEIPIGFPGG